MNNVNILYDGVKWAELHAAFLPIKKRLSPTFLHSYRTIPSCWNDLRGLHASFISPEFYDRTGQWSPSKLISESDGLKFEPRSRILIPLCVISTSLF
jgi:hypothetical protein